MIKIRVTENHQFQKTDTIKTGCWVNLTNPTKEEIDLVSETLSIERDLITTPLDEEERAHIEVDPDFTFIVIDIPIICDEKDIAPYNTVPLGIIITKDAIVTVSNRELPILKSFLSGAVRGFSTNKRTRFVLQLLYRNASLYLTYLRQIDRLSIKMENELQRSMKNHELIEMLRLEKSLVFFSTSLKANDIVMEKMMRLDSVQKYEDDQELMEDALIENKQAIEMCNIYRDVLSGTMDAFASLISNNLNIVMKVLTSVTLIMSVMTLVASLWGMNVNVPFQNNDNGFWLVLGGAAFISVLCTIFLWRRKMF